MARAQLLSQTLASDYGDTERMEQQICQELTQQRLADEFARKNKQAERKNSLLAELCNCEVYWAANYMTCLYDFLQARPDKNEKDFLRYNLGLKKIELHNDNRPNTSFTVSHKGKFLSLEELRAKLFDLLH